jgi:myo-inositol-1-phosphate synthase
VWDSPNSAGVVIDAIRCARLGLDRGLAGTLVGPAAYFMKSPPQQVHDDVAREMVEDFIAGRDDSVLTGDEEPVARPKSTRKSARRSTRARSGAAAR